MTYRIERGVPAHAERLRAIEHASSVHFREFGMTDVADHEPTPASIFEDRARDGLLYVALLADTVAGFLIWSPMDGQAYIEEVSVDPAHAGHKLAARMIDRLDEDIRGRHPAITLTTFRHVPWNGPYYATLGFEVSTAQGYLGIVTPVVEQLTGRKPTSVREYLTTHKAALTG